MPENYKYDDMQKEQSKDASNLSYQIGKDPPIFPVDPKKDNMISGAAKIMAEPAAEIVKKAYDKYRGKD